LAKKSRSEGKSGLSSKGKTTTTHARFGQKREAGQRTKNRRGGSGQLNNVGCDCRYLYGRQGVKGRRTPVKDSLPKRGERRGKGKLNDTT